MVDIQNSKVFTLIVLFTGFLTGCGSTPLNDDYIRHVNNIGPSFFSTSHFAIKLQESDNVDIRGVYVTNDTVEASTIMYQGGAGIAGMIAQIGTHSTLIQSQRNDKLAKAQEQANQAIAPIIEASKTLRLTELLDPGNANFISTDTRNPQQVLHIKPIFFSNPQMNKVYVKALIWIPTDAVNKHVRKRAKNQYQNMVQVYSKPFTEAETELLVAGDSELLKEKLSSLLNQVISIAQSELTGQYQAASKVEKTFVINLNDKRLVLRGAIVDQSCSMSIIQDIRHWLIAVPHQDIGLVKEKLSNDCSLALN